jgi:hypothetical protein
MLTDELIRLLRKEYVYPNVKRGHDFFHVERMVARGPEIYDAFPLFDLNEYAIAVWLHNVDRCSTLKAGIAQSGGLRQYLDGLLGDDFPREAKERIIIADIKHPNKYDEPGDAPLLTALRVADKLDRFNPTLLVEAPASWAHLPIFDSENPFGYDATEQGEHGQSGGGHKSIYQTYYRVLEWVPMMPEWARELIPREHLGLLITFLRLLGAQASKQFQTDNLVENDIRQALGPCYGWANQYIS